MGTYSDGSGDGYGSGSGYGYGYGYGEGDGSGYGSGSGSGCGAEEVRKEIELQILSRVPDRELPLYLDAWEFEETKVMFEARLRGYR
jgi:hypothetical protein